MGVLWNQALDYVHVRTTLLRSESSPSWIQPRGVAEAFIVSKEMLHAPYILCTWELDAAPVNVSHPTGICLDNLHVALVVLFFSFFFFLFFSFSFCSGV